ncbi:hypothetical protein JRQ81_007571 [Phrynocephalus forsythii]|uniref:Organic solute transporter subunit beta n=1 Tax=Phrynocephalus forsythii TaxID=171643 RepID=A0A9Q0XBU7_9SAUR|nr:hypothetical protein JRQ81_007571 [Phrynocephalus forsythii]
MKMFCITLYVMVYVSTDLSRPATVLGLTSTDTQKESKSDIHLEGDQVPPEMLQELLWLFREEDPSTWNYCILGLSCLVLVIGFFLLGSNIKANRSRKVALPQEEGYESVQADEAEMKPRSMLMAEEVSTDPAPENSHPQVQNMGQVTIQWKDGNVTNLYEDKHEEEA